MNLKLVESRVFVETTCPFASAAITCLSVFSGEWFSCAARVVVGSFVNLVLRALIGGLIH